MTALRHPEPAPIDIAHQLDAFRAFARDRAVFAAAASLHATALERWFHVTFREPERLVDAILLARIEDVASEDAATLRFLRDAEIPAPGSAHADLAIDRTVLIEQASPWAYLEGRPATAALAAIRGWQRRYARAYAEHYRHLAEVRARLLHDTAALTSRADSLARLNSIPALGPTEGREAIEQLHAALDALGSMPLEAADGMATTAGVRLGAPDERVRAFQAACDGVESALRSRLRRLSAALAG